ncbi:hypothetical protein AnigIFM60653_001167 [Aspergillus niger]|nr:hypothetical protein AnigIFM60653_001167 [Aspergillus niger]
MVCVYQEPPPAQPSRVEAELSAMNKRLDQLFSLLVPVAPISPDPRAAGLSDEYDASTEAGASPFDLPSKLLGNSSVMDVLGLDTDFAKSLIRGERTAQADESSEGGRPHLLIVHHRHAVSGLEGHDTNTVEMTRRVYWGVLLLENEIAGQLDLARSDIWCLDECVPLPLCQQTWEFTPEMASKALATSSPPHDAPLLNASEDATRSYFLAEVAMRRMLHRCNTAVQATSTGKYVYAPYIAVELERQLEEWYCHLLNISRFDKGDPLYHFSGCNIGSKHSMFDWAMFSAVLRMHPSSRTCRSGHHTKKFILDDSAGHFRGEDTTGWIVIEECESV